MKFDAPLIHGTLIKRYKRFLADIRLESGEEITAHCPNPGSMQACSTPGWRVCVSKSNNPKRKLPYTFEMIHNGQCWIGVNTMRPNQVIKEALFACEIPELKTYQTVRSEVKYGEKSRIDFLLESPSDTVPAKCYLEVKNVSLVQDGWYQFPDGVTTRGRKHLYELLEMVKQGHRAVSFFLIQRSDAARFKPAAHIDPAFAEALREVHAGGVEILVYQSKTSPEGIWLDTPVPFELN